MSLNVVDFFYEMAMIMNRYGVLASCCCLGEDDDSFGSWYVAPDVLCGCRPLWIVHCPNPSLAEGFQEAFLWCSLY